MFNKKSSKPRTEKQVIGKIGENYACDYLRKEGFKVIDRNYLRKWGELDIVAQKDKKIHFVEVKSVSRDLSADNVNVIRETSNSKGVGQVDAIRERSEDCDQSVVTYSAGANGASDKGVRRMYNSEYRPEDNLHPWKLKRLSRIIQSYLLDKDVSDDIDWQFDVITVYIDIDKGQHNVLYLPDIVL